MGIRIGIGSLKIGQGSTGVDWSSYWTTHLPSNLILTALAGASIKLDWTNTGTGFDGHSIERSADGINYSEIDTVAVGTNTFTDTGLTAQETYYYRVRAYKGSEYSPYCRPMSTIAFTTVYYVDSVDGSDVNNGTSLATAWKDAQYAAKMLTADDKVYLKSTALVPFRRGIVSESDGAAGNVIGISGINGNKAYVTNMVNVSHGQSIENLIVNGGCDAWLLNDTPYGVTTTNSVNNYVTKESTIVRSGNSIKAVRVAANVELYYYVYLKAGTEYTFSFYQRQTESSYRWKYYIRELDPALDNFLQTDGSWSTTATILDSTNSNGVFGLQTKTFTANGTGNYVIILTENYTTTSYLDDISLVCGLSTYQWEDVTDKNYKKLNNVFSNTPLLLMKCSGSNWTATGIEALTNVTKASDIDNCDATEGTWWFDTTAKEVYYHPVTGEDIETLHIEINQPNIVAPDDNNAALSIKGDYSIIDYVKCIGGGQGIIITGAGNILNHCSAKNNYVSGFVANVDVTANDCDSDYTYNEDGFACSGAGNVFTLNRCKSKHSWDDGFQAAGAGGIIANYCLSYLNGLEGGSDNCGFSSEGVNAFIEAYNCVSYLNTGNGIQPGGTGVNVVKNCISLGNAIDVYGGTNYTASNNCYEVAESWAENTDDVVDDPEFNDAVNGDFTLKATSPCINAGVEVAGLTEDYVGNPIVGVPDIGAYEYQG